MGLFHWKQRKKNEIKGRTVINEHALYMINNNFNSLLMIFFDQRIRDAPNDKPTVSISQICIYIHKFSTRVQHAGQTGHPFHSKDYSD